MIRHLCLGCFALLLLLPACSTDRAGDPTAPTEVLDTPIVLHTDVPPDDPLHDTLDWIFHQGDAFTYETVIEVEYTPGTAAYGSGTAASWDGDYPFYLYVPAGALEPGDTGGQSITITMRVPVIGTEFECTQAPMPIEFSPHGVDFREPVIVSLSQHPDLDASCEGYTLYYVEEGSTSGTYSYGGLQDTLPDQRVMVKAQQIELIDPLDPLEDPELLCRTGIVALVDHFSRWNLAQGGGGGSGGSPPIFGSVCP